MKIPIPDGRGTGATFRALLPVRAAVGGDEAVRVAASTTPGSYPDLTDVRVLYVDDDEESRKLVAAILGRTRASVRTAPAAAEALATYDEWKPQVVLTDIAMPELDGCALSRVVHARGDGVRVVALSAVTRVDPADECLFDAFVRKPAEPLTIAWAVHDALANGRQRE